MNPIAYNPSQPRFGTIYNLYVDKRDADQLNSLLQEKSKKDGVTSLIYINDDFSSEIKPEKPDSYSLETVKVHTGKLDLAMGWMTMLQDKAILAFQRVLVKPWAKPLMESNMPKKTKSMIYLAGSTAAIALAVVSLFPLKFGFLAVKLPMILASKLYLAVIALPMISNARALFGYRSGQKPTHDGDKVLEILTKPNSSFKFDLYSGEIRHKSNDKPVTEEELNPEPPAEETATPSVAEETQPKPDDSPPAVPFN